MAIEFELLRPEDKPALLALSTPEFLATARAALTELGYKALVAANHEEFATRFAQVQFQVVVLEEGFSAASLAENTTLQNLQRLPMNQRRHATIFLIGSSFESLNAMQAFQQSVHAVVNPAEVSSLGQIILKVVADNTLFLHIYRDTQLRMAEGKV